MPEMKWLRNQVRHPAVACSMLARHAHVADQPTASLDAHLKHLAYSVEKLSWQIDCDGLS
jgi:hypothetical protein